MKLINLFLGIIFLTIFYSFIFGKNQKYDFNYVCTFVILKMIVFSKLGLNDLNCESKIIFGREYFDYFHFQ